MVIPARIALAASSFAGKRSCSAELRDNWWRITVSRRTLPGAGRSCHILSLIPQRSAAGRNCTRILDVRSVALWILLSYGSDKVEHRLRLALSRIWVAARRFGFFTLRCMVRRLRIALSERKALARSTGEPASLTVYRRIGCGAWSCTK
jgi:hypothetical protein